MAAPAAQAIAPVAADTPTAGDDSDEDWGDPKEYDISIVKTGEGMETRNSTVPKPKKAATKEIQQAFADAEINLMALFSGDDPFAPVAGGKKDPF